MSVSKKNINSGVTIISPLSPIKTTEVYDTYWKFAALRQEAFFNKIENKGYPWSNDSIINTYRFTNAYRAADRVSQYLIRDVIYRKEYPDSPKEILFRILLFKLFNKIDTWELICSHIPCPTFENYDFNTYNEILNDAFRAGETIYSAAYIMPSVKSSFGYTRKHSNHLKLIELMLNDKAENQLSNANNMQKAFEIIKSFPGLGNFLAYQLLIDINYSTIINFSESEFVMPGPGALGGISKCFTDTAGLNEKEIIKLVTDRQEIEFERLGLDFKSLWGRNLQLIDCQNLFCEVDKYSRVRHPEITGNSKRTRIKQKYKCNHKPIEYWFPPKWDLNSSITEDLTYQNQT
ncbi:nucleotide kinase domain-containing protein [uncultured Maribacter sp.]|uniref:nucleotide kinase domain-containing protein n=1 Tax=uncultured Maribacter sp. TaxID=431308 RepID=UPI0030DC3CE5|tara:strand:- start:4309 stop:5352 length:1044 start_codon:yes stop_codon:yes gene_type:complete